MNNRHHGARIAPSLLLNTFNYLSQPRERAELDSYTAPERCRSRAWTALSAPTGRVSEVLQDAGVVGLPGTAQDRLPADVPGASHTSRQAKVSTFCMPSTGIYEHGGEKFLCAAGNFSLKFVEVRPGSPPLLHTVAVPRGGGGGT